VIVGIALIVYARTTAPAPVGPFLASTGHTTDTHWHAALGVYDCDHWLGDSTGEGIWNWPFATSQGTPGQAGSNNVYAGLHSHDDGIIHMEPAVSAEAGKNATVGLYFQYGGWKLSSTGYTFLGQTVKNGDKCGNATGTLQWATGKWDGNTNYTVKQKMTVQSGDPGKYKLYNDNIVTIAFLPPGKTIDSIGNPPSLSKLASALGAESAPPGAMPPTASTPTTQQQPTATTRPASATPTSKP
jgi:hypothetical protein